MKKIIYGSALVASALTAAMYVSPAHALTSCQSACNDRYLATVDSMWHAPQPAATPMPDYRHDVLSALDVLNTCLTGCPEEDAASVPKLSASASDSQRGYEADKGVDGNDKTRWWSRSGSTEWLQVDLGAAATIGKVSVAWSDGSYAVSYQIQISDDGRRWTSVYSTGRGKAGTVEHTFAPRSARYVRLYCTKATSRSNGYAVKELGIHPL